MMNTREIKRLLILNLPYVILGLMATNLGEAWRMAEGADTSAKTLSFLSTIPVAFGNPSLQSGPVRPFAPVVGRPRRLCK